MSPARLWRKPSAFQMEICRGVSGEIPSGGLGHVEPAPAPAVHADCRVSVPQSLQGSLVFTPPCLCGHRPARGPRAFLHGRHPFRTAMAFRFRSTARLGPLRLHFSKAGLSSISVGRRGASFNIPVNRRGGPRTTISLPGTGLSWTVEHPLEAPAPQPAPAVPAPVSGLSEASPLPNSRRLRPSQLQVFCRCALAALHGQLFGPGRPGRPLWEERLVSRLLASPGLAPRQRAQLALIETPDALEAYVRGAVSLDDAKRRSNHCIEAAELALRLAAARGWLH